jgi:hypothetical protein
MLVKYSSCRFALEYILTNGNASQLEDLKVSLSPETRAQLFPARGQLQKWIEYGAYIEFLTTADHMIGTGNFTYAYNMARYVTQRNIDSFFKTFFVNPKPDNFKKFGLEMWRQYFSEGSIKIETVEPNHLRFELTNISTLPEHYEIDILPKIEVALENSGATEIKIKHTQCTNLGDPKVEFEITWKDPKQ